MLEMSKLYDAEHLIDGIAIVSTLLRFSFEFQLPRKSFYQGSNSMLSHVQ